MSATYIGDHIWETTRTARRQYVCNRCRGPIPAGTDYVELRFSPAWEFTDRWWLLREHLSGECVR